MQIVSPDQPELDELRDQLNQLASQLSDVGDFPAEQLQRCADAGVFRWFVPPRWNGYGWNTEDVMRGYLKLSAGCLTTTFIITQYMGAARRIASSDNTWLKDTLLPQLVTGDSFSTVGISHLTTSRRHLAKPILLAEKTNNGFRLNGQAPWVTGAAAANWVVVGASLEDGQQILCTVPTELNGVRVAEAADLVALSASQTGAVEFRDCEIDRNYVIAGPVEEVMKLGTGARTGGVQTSALAVGLAVAAVDFLSDEAKRRPDLEPVANALAADVLALEDEVRRTARGEDVCSNEVLRTRANSLALRSTQAALTAAKGTGFVSGHPAGRWCREALFFLVWSCPQPVMAANLCELAGIA